MAGLVGPNGRPLRRDRHVYAAGIGDSASVTIFQSEGTHRREDVVGRVVVQVSEDGSVQVVVQPVDPEKLGPVSLLEDTTHVRQ